jgi:hypothetical protein
VPGSSRRTEPVATFFDHRNVAGRRNCQATDSQDEYPPDIVMKARTRVPTARQRFFPNVPLDPASQEELEREFFGTIRERSRNTPCKDLFSSNGFSRADDREWVLEPNAARPEKPVWFKIMAD